MDKLKDAIVAKLVALINNPHTSGSALVFGLLKLGGIIWPAKKPVLDEIAAGAVIYLGISAGDASKSATKQEVARAVETQDTSFLKNPSSQPSVVVNPPVAPTNKTP